MRVKRGASGDRDVITVCERWSKMGRIEGVRGVREVGFGLEGGGADVDPQTAWMEMERSEGSMILTLESKVSHFVAERSRGGGA